MTFVTKEFPARLEQMDAAKAFVLEAIEEVASMKTLFQVDVIIEELFVNICNYAYPQKEGRARVEYCVEEGVLFLRFCDSGIPYDPTAKEDAVAPGSIEDAKIGGLGILMVKKSSDSLSYCRRNGENVLLVTKTLKEKE